MQKIKGSSQHTEVFFSKELLGSSKEKSVLHDVNCEQFGSHSERIPHVLDCAIRNHTRIMQSAGSMDSTEH